MLSSVDWDQMIDSTNVNQSLLHWEQFFINVTVSCVSKGMLPKRKKKILWLSKSIPCAMQRNNNMHKLYGSSQVWNTFKTMRNKVTSVLHNVFSIEMRIQ